MRDTPLENAEVELPPALRAMVAEGRRKFALVASHGSQADLLASPGTVLPHRHDGWELLIVLSGAAVWSDERVSRVLMPGDVLLFPADRVHCTSAVNGHYVRGAIHLTTEHVRRAGRSWAPPGGLWQKRVPLATAERAAALLRPKAKLPVPESGRIADALALLADAESEPNRHPTFESALAQLAGHATRRLPTSTLAKSCFVSEGHLFHLFRKELGCSPLRLHGLLKIQRVRVRLAVDGSAGSVADLADEYGFADRRGLQRAFRRFAGMSIEAHRRFGSLLRFPY